MTVEEALKIIKGIKKTHQFLIQIHSTSPDDEKIATYDTAIQALEKQIPKKPIIGDTFTSKFQESIIKTGKYTDIAKYQSYKCPVCQQSIIMLWEAERNEKIYGCKCKDNFCKKCGQAFDWSDENDKRNIR